MTLTSFLTHLLQQPLALAVADRDHGRAVEGVAYQRARAGVDQGSGADGVDHHRHAHLVSEDHLPQIGLDRAVVEDAAAPEDQHVEPLHLRARLIPCQPADLERTLDAVPPQRVFRVAGEDGDLHGDLAELGHD